MQNVRVSRAVFTIPGRSPKNSLKGLSESCGTLRLILIRGQCRFARNCLTLSEIGCFFFALPFAQKLYYTTITHYGSTLRHYCTAILTLLISYFYYYPIIPTLSRFYSPLFWQCFATIAPLYASITPLLRQHCATITPLLRHFYATIRHYSPLSRFMNMLLCVDT